MKKKLAVAACLAVFGMAGSASAFTFDMGGGSYVDGSAFSDPGLVMQYDIDSALSSLTYDLAPGESKSFKFAEFWTNESAVNNDDLVAQDLTAHVDFDVPDLFGEVDGTSVGTKTGFFGILQGWKITWENPVTINFGYQDTGSFTLDLSDAEFASIFGPDGLFCKSTADVYATVTLDSEPVPEPATMLLFGTGMAGLAAIRRRRK